MIKPKIPSKIYLERDLMEDLKKWLNRREIYAIKGPRQSGKTTILRMLEYYLVEEQKVSPENVIYLTLEDRENLDKFEQSPKDFVRSFILGREKQRVYFLIDEVHYLKDIGRTLKLLFDLFENIKFIVTGSSSLELTAKTGKYLVGRVFSFQLFPFNFREFIQAKDKRLAKVYAERKSLVTNFLNKDIDFKIKEDIFLKDFRRLFEEYLIFGGYPEVLKTGSLETKKIILKNIYETYLTKDIIEVLKIRDVNQFRNLLKFLANQVGDLINYSNLASDIQSYYQEIKRLISALEETYIIFLLRPFFSNRITELKKNPKIYFFDLGLRNYIAQNFNVVDNRMDSGKLAENFGFIQIKNLKEEIKLNYWRTLAGAEVDFVLSFDDQITPIEVKYSLFQKAKISRSLKNFIVNYKPAKAIVLTKNFWGETRLENTKIKFIPLCYI